MDQKNKKNIIIESFDSFIKENKEKEDDPDYNFEKNGEIKLNKYIKALIAIKNQILGNIVECGERIKGEFEVGGLGGQRASKKYEKIFYDLLERVSSMLKEAKKEREKGRILEDETLVKAFKENYESLLEDTQKAIDGYTSEKNKEIEENLKNLKYKELADIISAAKKAFEHADELAKNLVSIYSIIGDEGDKKSNEESEEGSKGDKIDTSNIKIETPIKPWTGGEGNETVKKVQQLIYDKFKNFKGVGDTQLFKSFAAAKGFPDGKNGKNTSRLIVALKKGFGLKDTSPDITQEFVDQLYSMEKSLSTNENKLISFNQFIYKKLLEEKFDLSAFNSALKSFSSGGEKHPKKEDSTPFKNRKEGNKFRRWVNEKHPDWAKKNKLDPEGPFNNSYIRKAWKMFKEEYMKTYKK